MKAQLAGLEIRSSHHAPVAHRTERLATNQEAPSLILGGGSIMGKAPGCRLALQANRDEFNSRTIHHSSFVYQVRRQAVNLRSAVRVGDEEPPGLAQR